MMNETGLRCNTPWVMHFAAEGAGDLAVDKAGAASISALAATLVALVALNPWYWGLPLLLVLAGIAMNVTNTAANSFLQLTASPRLRGQTVSLYMLAMRGGLSVGSLLTGVLVSLLGVREALLINAALAVAAQIIIGRAWLHDSPTRAKGSP